MVYNYTKPRVPVAATYSGPGPCYSLPSLLGQPGHDPRSVHARGPAFPFGLRRASSNANCGPGPAYFPDVRVRRTGIDNPPAYTMTEKHGADRAGASLPGPMDYDQHRSMNCVSKQVRPPSFSFGLSLKRRTADSTPGPAAYERSELLNPSRGPIESRMRRAPSATVVSRKGVGGFDQDLAKSPGPGAYGRTSLAVYRINSPAYSMSTRNFMPPDNTLKPGPGAYDNHKTWITRKDTPKFSFGIRHSAYTTPLIIDVND